MRIRGALISIITAAALGLAWWLTSPDAGRDANAAFTPDFETGAITQISIEFPSDEPIRIVRTETPSGQAWVSEHGVSEHGVSEHGVSEEAGTEAEAVRWPVSSATVRAVLRAIRTAEMTPSSTEPTSTDDTTTVRLASDTETAWALEITGVPLAGRVSARWLAPDTEPVAVSLPADLWSVFRPASVRAWGETSPMVWTSGPPTRVIMRSGVNRVSLARGSGRWSVAAPVAAPADADAVRALLATLTAINATTFRPAQDGEGTEGVLAQIVVEHDRPALNSADNERITRTRDMRITGTADLGAGLVDVWMEQRWSDGTTFGPIVLAVPSAQLEQIAVHPGAYLNRLAIETAGILTATLSKNADTPTPGTQTVASIRKSGDGWVPADATAPTDADALATLVELLAQQPATAVDPIGDEALADGRDTLTLTLAAREPVLSAAVRMQDGILSVRIGGVVWLYSANAARPVADWLNSVLSAG